MTSDTLQAAATATTTEAVGADAASRDQAHTTAFAEHDGRYPGEGQRYLVGEGVR